MTLRTWGDLTLWSGGIRSPWSGVVFYRCRLGEGRELGPSGVWILTRGYGQVLQCDLGDSRK